MAKVQHFGTGRRKKSVARVRLVPGEGKVVINKRDMDNYFGLDTLKFIVNQPLVLTGTKDKKYGLKKARRASQFSKR